MLQPSPIQLPRPSISSPAERLSPRFVLSGHAEVHVGMFNGEGGCGTADPSHRHRAESRDVPDLLGSGGSVFAWEIAEHEGDPTKGMMGLTGL